MSKIEYFDTEEGKLTLVYIEVGRHVPKYALRNFRLTKKIHKSLSQIVFTDANKEIDFVKTIHREQIPRSDKSKNFDLLRKEWPHKQEIFWLETTKRFFHLYDLMLHLNLRNVVHLESDSILLEQKPLFEFFNNMDTQSMAYPLQASDLGCASILLLKSFEVLGEFLDHILDKWLQDMATDMTLLASFSHNERVMILPTWPKEVDSKFFYDAGSIGQYFQGSDARNYRFPFSRRGRQDERLGTIYKNLSEDNYSWNVIKKKNRLSIELILDGGKSHLVNIHMHSKQICSSLIVMSIILRIGFNTKRSFIWRLGFFDITVSIERLVSFWRRRILRKNHFTHINLR